MEIVIYSFRSYCVHRNTSNQTSMKERLNFCVKSECLGKNYHFDLYVMQNRPLLKTGTSAQFVTCT